MWRNRSGAASRADPIDGLSRGFLVHTLRGILPGRENVVFSLVFSFVGFLSSFLGFWDFVVVIGLFELVEHLQLVSGQI